MLEVFNEFRYRKKWKLIVPISTTVPFIGGHFPLSHKVSVGQGANSQFGPVRPTPLPSGHILASIVHATGELIFDELFLTPNQKNITVPAITENIKIKIKFFLIR